MDEHVVAALAGDEPESPVMIEVLHCALHDVTNLFLTIDEHVDHHSGYGRLRPSPLKRPHSVNCLDTSYC
jgi:hypothetical protein